MTATNQQPVAEICSASHDDAQFGERAIKPLCDISGFEYGTPLYAGAAPAAVAGPAIDRAATLAAIDDISEPSWTGYECPNTWADGLSAARAVVQSAPAAPALEAPAAPVDDRAEFEKWARQQSWIKDCQRYDDGRYGHYETEKAWATWQARAALAAAPQAPAAPVDEQSARDSACAWSVWWTHNKAKFTTPRQAALAAWNHANERALRAMAAPAAPAVDVETIEDAARFRAIVDAALTDDEAFDLALRQYPELGDDATIDDVRAMFDAARAAVAAQAKEGGDA
ncbi:hypothetical protein [Delftia sp.]|uniref:hypothetical protein n=1 Tax=Delftia sp. TaxID=1886637 RepID=UPI002579BAA9|nr:hypothetical protein [Delftia sp.]MPT55018.1 hypothetical protein [Delftia sp.]